MEIRALTGFDETVRKKYGRSYSPLSGIGAISPYEDLTDEQWTAMSAQEKINYGRNIESGPAEAEDQTKEFFIENYKSVVDKKINKYVKPLLIAGGIAGAILLYKKFK